MQDPVSSLPPLIDRQQEVARIAEALDAAERGEGELLLLRGEAGCGKTRLLQEAIGEASRRGFGTGFGTGLAESVTLYHPWREVLAGLQLPRILDEVPPPKILGAYFVSPRGRIVARAEREGGASRWAPAVSKLSTVVRGAGESDSSIEKDGTFRLLTSGRHRIVTLPSNDHWVGAILEGVEDEGLLSDLAQIARATGGTTGKDIPPRRERGGPRLDADVLHRFVESGKYEGVDYGREDPKLRRALLFERVILGLRRRAEDRPQVLAVDDLHWADPSSLALLHHVARNVRASRVLVLGAYRVEEAGGRPQMKEVLSQMEREGLPAGILIPGLPNDEMRQLAEVFLGPHALPGEFLAALWRETQGYPLFVREILRGLEEEGAIEGRGVTKRLLRPTEGLSLPRRVREAIRLRLERLSREERRLLDAAAACGTRFSVALVARLAGEEEHRVLPSLANLARVHSLLRAMDNGFAFDHPAIQEVVYNEIPDDTRKEYHLGSAEWLELVGGPVEDVAVHYYLAGHARAPAKLQQAARDASLRFANEEAVRLYRQALELERDPTIRRALLTEMGGVCELMGDLGLALKCFREALENAVMPIERVPLLVGVARLHWNTNPHEAIRISKDALALVAGSRSGEEGMALVALGAAESRAGEHERALEYYQRSLPILETARDVRGMMKCMNNMGNALRTLGRYDKAVASFRESLRISEGLQDQGAIGITRSNLGVTYEDMGDYEAAFEEFQKSLEIRERIGSPFGVASDLQRLSEMHGARGEFQQSLSCLERSADLLRKLGDEAGAAAALGAACAGRGRYAEALGHYEAGLKVVERLNDEAAKADRLCDLGATYLRMGRSKEAIPPLKGAYEFWEGTHQRWGAALTASLLTVALCDLERLKEASHYCLRARELAKETGSRECRVYSESAAAILCREQGDWGKAMKHFREWAVTSRQLGGELSLGDWNYEYGILWRKRRDTAKAGGCFEAARAIYERRGQDGDVEKAAEALRALAGFRKQP